eukprot:4472246-Heterocapsa_arctica.AAC.1
MRTLYNDVLQVADAAKMQSASAASASGAPAVGGFPVRDRKLERSLSDPASHEDVLALRRR